MPEVLIASLPYVLRGTVNTIGLAAVCVGLGTLLGVAIGLLAVLGPWIVRAAVVAYVFVVRGTPVLVLMFLAYFALPAFGLVVSATTAVAASLVVYAAAFVSEITRGAVVAVPRSQTDAARSLGLRTGGILRHVVLPQAMKLSLPPLANNSVIMVKATSYASVVGAWELTYAAREVVERSLAPFQIFLGVMVIYFVLCYPLSLLARRLERRFAFAH